MTNETAIIDIFAMTIAVDGSVDKSEIETVEKILDEMQEKFDESFKPYFAAYFQSLPNQPIDELRTKYESAVKHLSILDNQMKKYILRYIMKIVDADKIMHDEEVKLVADIMTKWGLD